MDEVGDVGPVVIGCLVDVLCGRSSASVVARTAVGAVEPYLEDFAVVRQQFGELRAEVLVDIVLCGVVRGVGVPGREVDAELHSVFPAGLRDELGDVDLRPDACAGRHVEVSAFGGPHTEAVVMLDHGDDARHAGALHGCHPLLAVGDGLRGVVGRVRAGVVAPLLAEEGVVAVVREAVELHLHPFNLTLGRHGEHGGRRVVRIRKIQLLEQLLRRGRKARQPGGQKAEQRNSKFFHNNA